MHTLRPFAAAILLCGAIVVAVTARQQPPVEQPSAGGPTSPAPGATDAESPRNANYEIDARLDEAAKTIHGKETIRWRNITNLPTKSASPVEDQIRVLLGKAAGIITISDYMRDYIQRWSGLDSTVLHFPSYGNGPYTHFNNFDSGYVTMVNPCSYKGISIFLSLAEKLPFVKFAAIPFWGTSEKDHAALKRLPNMTLLQPSPNLDDVFGQTKILLVPSVWGEAYGQVVVDAMLRGIPVLASNTGGLPEAKLGVDYVIPVNMVERYEQNDKMQVVPVIPEQDVSVWVETLRRVLTDRELYERVSLQSREAALSFVASLGPIHFEQYLKGLAARRKHAAAQSSA